MEGQPILYKCIKERLYIQAYLKEMYQSVLHVDKIALYTSLAVNVEKVVQGTIASQPCPPYWPSEMGCLVLV